MQQFQPLRRHLNVQLRHARDVRARPVEAGDEANSDRVHSPFEDDRNGRSRGLCRKRRWSSGRGNHGYLTTNQIGRQCGQAIIFTLPPAIFDGHVTAFQRNRFQLVLRERLLPVARNHWQKRD